MAYRILYGTDILWEPYSDNTDAITDATMSVSVNAAKYLDFTMPPTHSLYNVIAERDKLIRLYANDKLIYKGYITKITLDMEGYKQVNCSSVMSYLGDTHVRDYSTIEGEQPLKAPTSLDGLFQWYIDQHNKHCMDSNKRFIVGVNQAGALDENNYVYRSSTQFPTTSSEIEEKILNLGGYIFERYEGDNNILDFYADAHEANTQILDFGVNITDFTHERSGEDQYTAIYATGYTPDPPEDDPEKKMKPISLADIQNGGSPYSPDLFKLGDVLYSISGVQRYGYREYYYSNDDITTTDYLLKAAGVVLTKLLAPTITLDVKAVDMALFMENGYEHLQLGQAVRVRSKPHNIDEYLMISGIDLDLQDPGQTTYTIGATYDTLTGQQSSYLKSLNSGINSSLDSVAALDKATKENAKGIDEAKKDAANATSKANEASNKADTATETANSANTKADEASTKAETATETANSANTKADEANSKADTATETANSANTKANEANAKADTATETANSASTKADEAKADAANANSKADAATETANSASSKADTAIGSAKDAADKAASASQKADDNTAKITIVENTINTISGNTATAIANAKAAQDAADAAKQAADQAQSDANTANTEIGKVQSQVGTINTEISNIKQEATDLRDDLSGQITTVKNTMEADYTRKTELSDTTATLRNEISQSAAGIIQTVSQDYATKNELKTTTDATNKNTEDLTKAINKFNTDVDNLQGQIDGAIETWFYEVDPTDENEPAVNWNTDDLKKVHLGDLYYNTVSGYCWRYQLQNGSYSWSRITDVDVTKALADAAAAQTTANSKKRIFVTTPNPPYDIGDLWTQGSAGDIMRCQTAKTSSQSYADADWVKASKYTDDTAVTNLSNTVEKTYSTKTEVKQLSDQVSSTVSSLETVQISAEAAQTSADNAKKAADAAQTAADAAKDNAATAQSKANEAAKNLAAAEKNLETLQSQANATDEQLTAAKSEVEKAKTAAATAQSTANTAKDNAATAQATADEAKVNAKKAQEDVNTLKNRVTTAETSIKQNSDAIVLRATKTEVTEAVNKNKSEIISMGEQLVINGNGLMGDNTNFSSLTFDASKSNGSAGSFTRIGSTNSVEYSDNFFPVSPTLRYSFELDAMSSKEKAAMYSFLDFYDVDKKQILDSDHMYIQNTLTTLAKDLKNGDTVVYLTDMTNWLTSGGNGIFTRGFIFWNYKNSFGYTYPEHTYSRNHYYDLYTDSGINTIAKTITLKNPWTYGTFQAGTKVSQSNSGGTFKYQAMVNTIPPSIWKHYSGHYDGTDYSGQNVRDKFPPGAAYAKVGFLWNYNKSDDQVWVTNISVKTDYKHAIDEVATRVTNAETKIEQNSEAITLRATKTEVTEVKSTADTAKSKADAIKTDLESNYSTTTQMNSAIDVKAEGIVSTVSKTYQVKGDYAIKSEVDQTIEGVETKITTVTDTTNTLNTLIRQSGNGVEVAKKVNGAYTSTKTLMDSDGFYVKDDSGNNLTQIKPAQAIIGKAESKNVLVNSNGINIRNGENTIASFSEDIVELGKNSKNSVINMCNKNGSIEVVADDGSGYGENFTITGKSGAAIRYQALMEDPNKEGYYIPYEKAQVYVNKRVGNAKVKEAGMSAYDKTYGNARILVSVNEPIYDNNYALIDARNIYLNADKSVKINGSGILYINESLYIKNNRVSDFVVAEGKCDFWTYRMWNSGIAECWGHTSETTVSVTSEWGYMYDSGTGHTNGFPGNTTASSALKFNVTIGGKKYTKLFTSVEHCDCNFISSDNVFIIEIGSGLTNLQTPQVFLLRPTSADVTGKFSYHAIGRWKA